MASRRSPYKKPDHFTVEAKRAGYPARSVFKLEEIDRRVRLLRPGMRVLDLGAAPGSWTLYACQRVGPGGRVLAIDKSLIGVPLPPHARFDQGDALELGSETLSVFAPYDVVLSDMAPNTTGNRSADQARSFELFMRALQVAATLTKVGGSFVGKIFMGEDLPLARKTLREHFETEKLIRPEGTRSVSYELFLIGLGRRAPGAG
jgi:23S rRNA (uridine2552-2'-O)-methyltransferase